MSDLKQEVTVFARRHDMFRAGDTIVAGVSGGPDSLCLLHLLLRLAPEMDLRVHVAHLNHTLRGQESDADAAFVEELARSWNLPVTVERADVREVATRHHLSIEEAARRARYAFLARTAGAAGASRIAAGHHAGDQAETVLMHFLRGSGAAGLRGILPVMPLSDYRGVLQQGIAPEADLLLVRPLLAIRRADIEDYCAEHGLVPRVDASNADVTIYRNRLRHELLPILRQYNPRIDDILGHTAEVMAGDYEILAGAVDQAMESIEVEPAERGAIEPGEIRLDLVRWRALPVGLQRGTVRAAVRRLRRNLRNINWEHIESAVRIGRGGATGDSATIAAGLALTVEYDALVICPVNAPSRGPQPQVDRPLSLRAPGITLLDGGWRVCTSQHSLAQVEHDYRENADPWLGFFDADVVGAELFLRPRNPGDRFQPFGLGGHSAHVNEFMINAKVPAAQRAGWPLLVGASGIAWVCGLRIDTRAAITPVTERVWQVRFER